MVDDLVNEHSAEIYENEMIALLAEIKRDLNSYLEKLSLHLCDPWQISQRSTIYENKMLEKIVDYPQDMFVMANMTNGINKTGQEAISKLEGFSRNGFEKLMKENQLDALMYIGQKYVPFIAVGGYPAITVPRGYNNENMPLGISFGGLRYSEPTLIEIACAFEHATKKRRPPPDDLMQFDWAENRRAQRRSFLNKFGLKYRWMNRNWLMKIIARYYSHYLVTIKREE